MSWGRVKIRSMRKKTKTDPPLPSKNKRGWLIVSGALVLCCAVIIAGAWGGFFKAFRSAEWVGFIAAMATVLSAAVIAWQSRETSRAADASNRAANTAERSLALTNDALAESIKIRLDSQAANVIPTYDLKSEFLVYRRRRGADTLTLLRTGEPIDLPHNRDDWLYVDVPMRLSNSSNVPVAVTGSFLFSGRDAKGNPKDRSIQEEVHLEANATRDFNMLVGAEAQFWVDIQSTDLGSDALQEFRSGWATNIPGLSGVSMIGQVQVQGPILRMGNEPGRWLLRDPSDSIHNSFWVEEVPVKREYYIDHVNGVKVGG